MKSFKDIFETVNMPKGGDEKAFWDKHIVDKKDNPNAAPGQFTSDKKKAKRRADYDEGDEKAVYEAAEVHTKRADKEAVIVRDVDPKTGQSRAKVVKRAAGEIKIGEETDLGEKVVNPYAVGMAAAMKQAGDKPPLKKSTIVKGHEIAKSIKKEAMDPVGKHDADIDNDGDTDKSDKYLIKRRKAITRAVNEAVEVRHDRYMRSHGKKARDSGEGSSSWMFTHKGMGDVDYKNKKEVHTAQGKFADAKKSAQQWAKEHGHSAVYVMEEVEQIDELSQDTLNSYHSKAGADRLKAKATVQKTMDMKKPATSTVDKATSAFSRFQKRGKGMTAAANKMSEETNLDEVSKATLGSYIKKAAGNIGDAAAADDTNKELKRHKGIAKATDKLTKEEVDQIDEAFKVGAMHLEDGSSITLTREDVDMLNGLFKQLNSSNKTKMEQRLKSSKNGFNEIITFAKEVV